MHDYRKLEIWNRSMDLVIDIYKSASNFPIDERFGIISQIKRSAVSIPSNIAEGCGRGTDKQLMHFLDIAIGSAFELETQIEISQRLEFIGNEKASSIRNRIQEISKMINGFKRSLST